MRQRCAACSRSVLYTFIETIANVQLRTNRPRWPCRGLTTQAATTSSEAPLFPTQRPEKDFVTQHAQAKAKAEDVTSWQKQRAAMFGAEEAQSRPITVKASRAKPGRVRTSPVSTRSKSAARSIKSYAKTGRVKQSLRPSRTNPGTRAAKSGNEGVKAGSQGFEPPKKLPSLPSLMTVETATDSAAAAESKKGRLADGSKDRWRRRPEEIPGEVPTEEIPGEVPTEEIPGEVPTEEMRLKSPGVSPAEHYKQRTSSPATPTDPSKALPKSAPNWLKHRETLKKKLNGTTWAPLKRLSPDAMDGVRQLHAENPTLWSTASLAEHFKISPEGIRRILKSKWRPSEEERAEQEERWVRRGEAVWDRYVELGMKAPRRWRGLNSIAPPKPNPEGKKEWKPEEWNKDVEGEGGDEKNTGLGLGLGNRIT